MGELVSVQIEMKAAQSDCLVFELPNGITKVAFDEIIEVCIRSCEYKDEWINKVRQSVFDKVGKYPDIRYKTRAYEDSELELLQVECGDIFSEVER